MLIFCMYVTLYPLICHHTQWQYSAVPGLLGQQTEPQWSKPYTYHQRPVSDRLWFCHNHVNRADTALHFWPLHTGDRTDEFYSRPALHTPTQQLKYISMFMRSLNYRKTFNNVKKHIILPKRWHFKWIPDSLGLNIHFLLQTALCRSWCHRSGRRLNCWKLVSLKDITIMPFKL